MNRNMNFQGLLFQRSISKSLMISEVQDLTCHGGIPVRIGAERHVQWPTIFWLRLTYQEEVPLPIKEVTHLKTIMVICSVPPMRMERCHHLEKMVHHQQEAKQKLMRTMAAMKSYLPRSSVLT